ARALGRSGDKAAVAPLAALLASDADADVYLAAASLDDLRRRHQVRCGSTDAVDEELRRVGRGGAAPRRGAGWRPRGLRRLRWRGRATGDRRRARLDWRGRGGADLDRPR